MQKIYAILGLSALLVGLSALNSAQVSAQEAKQRLDILGFSADAQQMLVKIDDVNTGLNLRLYDVETGAPAKKSVLIPYQRVEGIKVIKEAKKKYKIKDDALEDTTYPLDPKDPDKMLSFFGVMRGAERLVLAATDGGRMGKVSDVTVKRDEETKTLAKASQKTIYWTPDRKTMVFVVSQKLVTDGYSSDTDEFHAVRFSPDKIRWVEPAAPETAPPPASK